MVKRYLQVFFICVLLAGGSGCRGDGLAAVTDAEQNSGTVPAATQTIGESGTAGGIAETAVTVTVTLVATATEPPMAVPPPTSTTTPVPSPSPTVTAEPTLTPLPTPTETAVPVPAPDWLNYLNRFRAMAKLPLLTDHEDYTVGSRLHSRYMVGNNEPVAHFEEEEKPFYDPAGDESARNANLFATSQLEADYVWSINFWISAPFHLINILDPKLEFVGFGEYKEAVGETQMAAVLDIRTDPLGTGEGIEYPIMFPGDGSETWVVRHSLFEWPYPFDGCPGFEPPTGPPVVLLLGDGSKVPDVTSHRFAQGEEALESCLFDETSYRNNDPYAEKIGREILGGSDAVVIMPREPLAVGETYTAQVTADGQTYTWRFSVRRGPD